MVIPVGIAGLAALGVGVIFSIIWVNLAFAAIYAIIQAKNEKNNTVPSL